jgi:hypothetical protein
MALSPWCRHRQHFDAVICDPPYGLRARHGLSNATDNGTTTSVVTTETKETNGIVDMTRVMIDFSISTLVDDGYLVFWSPVDFIDDTMTLPTLPLLPSSSLVHQLAPSTWIAVAPILTIAMERGLSFVDAALQPLSRDGKRARLLSVWKKQRKSLSPSTLTLTAVEIDTKDATVSHLSVSPPHDKVAVALPQVYFPSPEQLAALIAGTNIGARSASTSKERKTTTKSAVVSKADDKTPTPEPQSASSSLSLPPSSSMDIWQLAWDGLDTQLASYLSTPKGIADIDRTDTKSGSTPLMFACGYGHLSCVQLLIKYAANLDLR